VSYNGIQTTASGETIGILLIITPAVIVVAVAVVKVRKHGGVSTDWLIYLL